MKGLCLQAGLQLTNNPEIADLLVINTCIVKEPTEKKIERRLQDLTKKYPQKKIIVAGCMADVMYKKFLNKKNIYLLSNKNIKQIALLIKDIEQNKPTKKFLERHPEVKLCLPKIPLRKNVGITQISEGCLGNCSFCIVRLAKGKLFSYPQEEIIKNIENDLKSCKEIWITSQDNASYGLPEKRKLPELMSRILKLKGKFKVRLGMMNPENVLPILPELIEIYKNEKMTKFLHLPLQSGSNKILKLMRRKYTIEDFLEIVKNFRKEIPDLFLSTDIIVGFPGETEEDFLASLDAIKKIKPQQLNISRFWVRKGTEAEKMEQLPPEIVKNRIKRLTNLYKKIKSNFSHLLPRLLK